MKKLAFSFILVNLLAACAIHTPFNRQEPPAAITTLEPAKPEAVTTPDVSATAVDKAAIPDASATPEAAATGDAAPKAEASDVAKDAKEDALNDSASPLAIRSVHFPFDVDAIQEADKATIQAHGAYLASHQDVKIRVEGNADERGSSEYNLALGQRRANHTKKALVLAGAKVPQIEAISYGEEKPLAAGHDETAWAQNRRADINYIK